MQRNAPQQPELSGPWLPCNTEPPASPPLCPVRDRWRGLCIDGHAGKLAALSKVRSCKVVGAAVGSGAELEPSVRFREFRTDKETMPRFRWMHGLSGLVEKGDDKKLCWGAPPPRGRGRFCKERHELEFAGVTVVDTRRQVVSLAELLREHAAPRVIGYLSLDVEGHEEAVLADFDFRSYTFLARRRPL